MIDLVITKDRWDKLLYVTERALSGNIHAIEEELWKFSDEERMLLVTVLKNNTPFNVMEK